MSGGVIGVAVTGLGVGEQHARIFAAQPRARILWLHDLDEERARRLAPAIPGSRVAADFGQILADGAVHVVSIASFDDAHFGQARDALRAGKHVFVEKPLCTTAEELAELRRLWGAAGGRLKIGSNLVLRTAPLYRELKRRIESGELGTPYAFDGDYLYGRLHKITEGWRSQVKDYSVTLGGGIHMVDLMLWLTGQRPRVAVSFGNRISSEGTAFPYDDFRAATLQFESGLVARISANFGSVHRHQHVVRVFGTRGTFLYDDAGARWHASRDPAQPSRPLQEAPLPATKGGLIPGFLDAVCGDTDYAEETRQFFDSISICLACDQAAKSRQAQDIVYS